MAKRRRGNGQGTLFKRTPRGSWIASWFDHTGKRRERSTRTTDKATAERVLRQLVATTALRREGVIDVRTESAANDLRRPISDAITAWQCALEAKGTGPMRIECAVGRASRLAQDCGFDTLGDIDSSRVNTAIHRMIEQGCAPRTVIGYTQAIRQLTRWVVKQGWMRADPLVGVESVSVKGRQTRTRRALSPEELGQLLRVTAGAAPYRRLSGSDRAMLYEIAVGTGFRARELRSLTPSCFDLDREHPSITVRAGYSKRRRDDVQPIHADLASRLRTWIAGRPREAPVFKLPDKLAMMLRADLRRAREDWVKCGATPEEQSGRRASDFLRETDSAGHVVDFHALRVTYITMLVRGGATVREAQSLARHSDPKLTLNVYAKLGINDLSGALNRMPMLSRPPIDDPAVDPATHSLLLSPEAPPAGFEPATSALGKRCSIQLSYGGVGPMIPPL